MKPTPRDSFPPIKLPDGGRVRVRRCEDALFCKAQALSIAITWQHWMMLFPFWRSELPHVYVALTVLTGPSGPCDDWKGAFSFAFKLTVRRKRRESRYLLHIVSHRSMVLVNFYRVLKPGESYDRTRYHAPFDDELSELGMLCVIKYIEGFLLGFLETMPPWTVPFVKEVPSNFILFGYDPKEGRLFEQEYDSQEAYDAALKSWRSLLPPEVSVLEDW